MNFAKKIIKSSFNFLGYEIIKSQIQYPLLLPTKSLAAGRVIEFIAPSGAGKSHLMQLVSQKLQPNWITQKQLANYYRSAPPHHSLKRENSLFKNNEQAEVSLFFNELIDRILESPKKDHHWHKSMPERKIHLVKCCLEHINEHYMIEKNLPVGVIVDEGLFFWAGKEIMEMKISNNYPALNRYLARRVLVSVEVDPEVIFKQVKNRMVKFPMRQAYKNFSDTEIYNEINYQQQAINNIVDEIEPFVNKMIKIKRNKNFDIQVNDLISQVLQCEKSYE